MTELEDDLILESVTYFKYPSSSSSSNENEVGFDFDNIKTEAKDVFENPPEQPETYENSQPQQNDYTQNGNYSYNYSPYYQNQNQCNNYVDHNGYSPYENYGIKQEIKQESYDSYCNKEEDCYSSPHPYMNTQYAGYHHPQQQQQQQPQQQQQQQQPPPPPQQPYQNGHYWNNGWNQQYPEQQQCCSPQSSNSPVGFPQQSFSENGGAKKRGRKKKIRPELDDLSPTVGGAFPLEMANILAENGDGKVKERRKHDRFNGMPEEEVSKRTLPDLLATNLDIVIIGINPGLFAAYKGHHYAGPGNHFWKCLYMSGLITEQLTADDDYRLLQFGIGFTNMVERATKGSSDLTRKEIREGGQILLEKLQQYKPKIAVFNGKLIFEVFSGKKEFNFGRQPEFVDGTNTYMWVMPSSSARCAQLPRASDKVPYYAALKKFRDYLNGTVSFLDENDVVFQYCKLKTFPRNTIKEEKFEDFEELDEDDEKSLEMGAVPPKRKRAKEESKPPETTIGPDGSIIVKKKRGRPKKIRPEAGQPPPPVAPPSAVQQPPRRATPTTHHVPLTPPSHYPPDMQPSPPFYDRPPGAGSPSAYCQPPPAPPNYSPSYQYSSPGDAGYCSQSSLESAFSAYDFHPAEIQSHLRSFLPSSAKAESPCAME